MEDRNPLKTIRNMIEKRLRADREILKIVMPVSYLRITKRGSIIAMAEFMMAVGQATMI